MALNHDFTGRYLTFWDGALLLLLLLAAILLMTGGRSAVRNGSGTVVVEIEGRRVYTAAVSMSTMKTFYGHNGLRCVVEIGDGRARIVDADCPDKLCRRTGWVVSGGAVVCLPARLSLRVEALDSGESLDGITR